MAQRAAVRQLKKVKIEVKAAPVIVATWGMAVADAEARIARLRRSIELFKQYEEQGLPFPTPSSTLN